MDRASRFPDAIPMRCISSKVVFEKLMDFISRYGLPHVIQTDCGTNFTSKLFRGNCAELAIKNLTSVAYNPESQGVVKMFHQTLKLVLKKHCYDPDSDWDKALLFALFAIRNHPYSSTGVVPF
ncbi:igE-binding protein-like [Palaemon carinicauda]|uniref:igE-binding protein-like n=1 Tax=Palaemon carinicauda TaxID=392227 RepID=UPI0035B67429